MYLEGGGSSEITTTQQPRRMGPQLAAVFTPPHCEWRVQAERRLLMLYALKVGWDGHAGKPAQRNIVEYTASVLGALMRPGVPMPSIMPLSNGAIQLEWHRNGWDIEVEVSAPNTMCVYTKHIKSGIEEEFEINNNLALLMSAISHIKN